MKSDAEFWAWFATWRADCWALVAQVNKALDKAGV